MIVFVLCFVCLCASLILVLSIGQWLFFCCIYSQPNTAAPFTFTRSTRLFWSSRSVSLLLSFPSTSTLNQPAKPQAQAPAPLLAPLPLLTS